MEPEQLDRDLKRISELFDQEMCIRDSLKRHYQFWFSIIALHKLGAVCIPATHLLTTKDLVYRNNAASVKSIICTSDGEIAEHVEASQAESPTLEMKFIVNGDREGWLNLDAGMEACSDVFPRPAGEEATHNEDMMLLYFTSGTTGMPKMVGHDFVYPLGHIVTGAFWHQVQEDGIHLTVSDTGWGKAVWGKLYGQWMACLLYTSYSSISYPSSSSTFYIFNPRFSICWQMTARTRDSSATSFCSNAAMQGSLNSLKSKPRARHPSL